MLRGIGIFTTLKRDIEPSEAQRMEFAKCVLTNKPFTQVYEAAEIRVVCTSPNSKEYEELGNFPDRETEFEKAVIRSVLQEVTIKGVVVYRKGAWEENWADYFQKTLGESPLQVWVLEKVVVFYNLFRKLLQELLEPDFFVKITATGQS